MRPPPGSVDRSPRGSPAPAGAAYAVPALLALVPSCLALAGAVALSARAWVDTDPWAGVGFVYAVIMAAPALTSLTLLVVAHRSRRHSPGTSQALAWTALAVIGLAGLAAVGRLGWAA
ncbi:hypothetical protein I601_0972 [Nocardioides dokdonensis FR1436]|uniref:Uncharacterized protein n=1 Tax=Nocardioides dokdonensis FR1436 TaxID=1300347 RepID=A0A1A9GIX4_9ACTN|nr:hypothetical protein [Nocardioides dokdonensis]ANH37415.1 hypothetical protein I601_0972 [Nocardioides dokdonensis FR1436]